MLTPLFAVLDTARLILAAQAAPLTVQTILSCYSSMLVTLAMSLGAVICLCHFRASHQTRCVPQESVHPLPDAVVCFYPGLRRFYAALCAGAWETAAHTISQTAPSAQKADLPADRPHRPSVPKNLFDMLRAAELPAALLFLTLPIQNRMLLA